MGSYKLLLVDDFFVERENVKEMVRESDLDLVIIGEAGDGIEALEAIEAERPDFVLTDIEMPLMDGLELTERIRLQYPDIHVIFFTFYEKFEYARRAVQLGAASFILKPVFKEELLAELSKIIARKKKANDLAEQEQRLRERLKESMPLLADKFKRELFSGACRHLDDEQIRNSLGYYALDIPDGLYLTLAVEVDRMDGHPGGGNSPDAREMRMLRFGELVAESVEGCPSVWSRYGDDRWVVLLAYARGTAPESAVEDGYGRAEKLIARMETENAAVSVGIGEPFDRLAQTGEAVERAMRALSHKFYRGYGQMIRASDIEEMSPETGWPNHLREQLQRFLDQGDEDAVERFVDWLFAQADGCSPSAIRGVCFAVIDACGQWLGERRPGPFAERGGAGEDLLRAGTKEWLTSFLLAVLRLTGRRGGAPSGGIAEGAKAYIEDHYQEAITIKRISDHLHYSPNYLNQMFKQETGVTLLEYLTKVRIEKAKKLLSDTDRKVFDVMTAVGYNHETYFRNVFKHYTGLTPKDYREISKR